MGGQRRIWKVVGGADKGGIIVRDGQELGSPKLQQRLQTGALVSEEKVVGDRLHFVRVSGSGPQQGWVSIRLGEKELLQVYEENSSLAPAKIPEWFGPLSEQEWSELLSPYELSIMRDGGTDPPGSHPLCKLFPTEGYFACAACGFPLYSCAAKFHDWAWPSWDRCFFSEEYGCHVGTKYEGAVENHCARCQSHLGHIFFGEHHTATDERH